MNTDIPLCFPVGYAEGCVSAHTLVGLRVSNCEQTCGRELTRTAAPRPLLFDSVHVCKHLGLEGESFSRHLSVPTVCSFDR